jgi:hypothetical protein
MSLYKGAVEHHSYSPMMHNSQKLCRVGKENNVHRITRKYCSCFIHSLRQMEARTFYKEIFNSNQIIGKLLNVEVST